MKKILLLVFALLVFDTAQSQYSETIATSRPGQAFVPFTTGKYVFQVQSGVTHTDFDDSGLNIDGNSQDFFTILRYGLLEDFEIRSAFGFNKLNTSPETSNSISDPSGFSLWSIGVRYNIVSGEGYKPSFGLQTDVHLNIVGEEYRSEEIAPRMMLIHSQQLSETFGLTTNWSIDWNGDDNTPTGNYVINISFPITDRLGSFIENYGQISNGDVDTRWDTGLGYLINNNLLIDISFGYGQNEGLTDWFIDAGISWRTKFK